MGSSICWHGAAKAALERREEGGEDERYRMQDVWVDPQENINDFMPTLGFCVPGSKRGTEKQRRGKEEDAKQRLVTQRRR